MRPACFNRAPYMGQWMPAGWRRSDLKPKLRWVEFRLSDRCASWDSPDVFDSVPARERWDCLGCRWLPIEGLSVIAGRWLESVK